MSNRARYIWLIDEQPVNLSSTEIGDVTGSIEVGMEFETTFCAFEDRTFSVLTKDMVTSRTFLAGITGIYKDNGLSLGFTFVKDELLKLTEGPVPEVPIEPLPEFLILLDVQFLQCYRVERLGNYPLGNLVVVVSHEPSFPSRDFLQFSLGRTGAYGLKFPTEILILSFDLSNVIRTVEPVIAENGMVENSGIDSEDFLGVTNGGCPLFYDDTENEILPVKTEGGSNHLPIEVFPEISWDFYRDLDSAVNGGHRDETLFKIWFERPLVVTDARPLFLGRKCFELDTFQHLGCCIPSGSDNGRWYFRIFFSDWVIGEMMEFEFIIDSFIETDVENVIGCTIDGLNGVDKPVIGFETNGDRTLHSNERASEEVVILLSGEKGGLADSKDYYIYHTVVGYDG